MTQIKINIPELSFQTNEAIKMLRTSVQFSGVGVKTISVISSFPNEGKSFIAFNMANTFAELGKKTIFVDCDIRNSVIQKELGIEGTHHGLSDFLVGEARISDVILSTDVNNLNIMLCGNMAPNPAELLGSVMFEKLVNALRQSYDYVIFDNAPISKVTDGVIVSQHCDGTILVIGAESTDRRAAAHSKQVLEKANVKVLGAVLNKAGGSGHGYGKYGKNGYGYGYGYGYGQIGKE